MASLNDLLNQFAATFIQGMTPSEKKQFAAEGIKHLRERLGKKDWPSVMSVADSLVPLFSKAGKELCDKANTAFCEAFLAEVERLNETYWDEPQQDDPKPDHPNPEGEPCPICNTHHN